tara:strand:+ start:420 stop:1046 length:627 start_codon:yes stop_codon:yes gene_type:complete
MADAVDSNQLADFQGLPLKALMTDPLISASAAQKDLAAVTLDFINDVGFTTDKDGNTVANCVTVEVPRFVVGQKDPVYERVSMPLLSVVTIPNLVIDDIEISFTVEVKSHTEDQTSNDSKQEDTKSTTGSATASGSFWGAKASATVSHTATHTGTVAAHSENTRSTDFSAKYNITISAKQQPPAEGMSRFVQILANTIESVPINTAAA